MPEMETKHRMHGAHAGEGGCQRRRHCAGNGRGMGRGACRRAEPASREALSAERAALQQRLAEIDTQLQAL